MPDLDALPSTRLLRRSEVSEYLLRKFGVQRTPGTLAWLAVNGKGPKFRHIGAWPFYAEADVDQWVKDLAGPVVRSTSENRKNPKRPARKRKPRLHGAVADTAGAWNVPAAQRV